MWYYSKEIRTVFFSLVASLFLLSSVQTSFSQTDEESIEELSEEDLRLVEEYLDQAETLFEQRFTESTIFYYDKVLAIDSLNINALNGKALVLDFVGSHEEAISYYDRVLLIDSKNNEAQLGKSLTLESIVSEEEPLLEISDDDLDLLEEYLEQAEELFEEESYQEAISYYNQVLEIDSTDIDALNGKALALDLIGKSEEAISSYDRVLSIDSSNKNALFGTALALENLGKYEEAISFYNKVLAIEIDEQLSQKISDDDLDLLEEYLEQAEELFEEESYQEAISYYDQVLEIDSINNDAFLGKALSLESLGREEESLSNLEQITIQDPPKSFLEILSANDENLFVSEEINEFGQTLFAIMAIIIVGIASIIVANFVLKKRKLQV